jgi:hypothetical protein
MAAPLSILAVLRNGLPRSPNRSSTSTPVTRLSPDETCSACGSLLVPPELASGFTMPKDTDYVCLKCARSYRWTDGNPPRLMLLVVANRHNDDADGGE